MIPAAVAGIVPLFMRQYCAPPLTVSMVLAAADVTKSTVPADRSHREWPGGHPSPAGCQHTVSFALPVSAADIHQITLSVLSTCSCKTRSADYKPLSLAAMAESYAAQPVAV